MDKSVGELRELVTDREDWRAAIQGRKESDMTELNWTGHCLRALCILSHWTHTTILEGSTTAIQLYKWETETEAR